MSEKCLALVSSLRGGLFGGWMQGQANKAEERMKKRNSWFVTSCDIKSKSISASRFGDDFYPQILANTVNSTCSKHYNFTWQQFLCCVLLPELCKRVCVCVRACACICVFVECSLHLRAWLIRLILKGVGGDICSSAGVRARCVCSCYICTACTSFMCDLRCVHACVQSQMLVEAISVCMRACFGYDSHAFYRDLFVCVCKCL